MFLSNSQKEKSSNLKYQHWTANLNLNSKFRLFFFFPPLYKNICADILPAGSIIFQATSKLFANFAWLHVVNFERMINNITIDIIQIIQMKFFNACPMWMCIWKIQIQLQNMYALCCSCIPLQLFPTLIAIALHEKVNGKAWFGQIKDGLINSRIYKTSAIMIQTSTLTTKSVIKFVMHKCGNE